MQLQIDQNNILSIHHPDIATAKEYKNTVSGYTFSSLDKGIIVYHKKQIKTISLKNLGDNMSVFYISARSSLIEDNLDPESFLKALILFKGFDEETGLQYYFFPKFPINDIEKINSDLSKLGFTQIFQKTNKGVTIPYFSLEEKEYKSVFSFLFGLVLTYGKLDIKNGDLISAKIHIPLYGGHLSKKQDLEDMVKHLQDKGIFVSISSSSNQEGEVIQISISDYEVLASFANFYQSIEKIQEISKQDNTEKIKSELIDYINNKLEVEVGKSIEGKENTISSIQNGTLKILTK